MSFKKGDFVKVICAVCLDDSCRMKIDSENESAIREGKIYHNGRVVDFCPKCINPFLPPIEDILDSESEMHRRMTSEPIPQFIP